MLPVTVEMGTFVAVAVPVAEISYDLSVVSLIVNTFLEHLWKT